MNDRIAKTILTVALISSAGALCNGQSTVTTQDAPPASPAPEYSMEGLNLIGAIATMPEASDTMLGTESDFRRALFSQGLLLRANSTVRFAQNLLDSPVPANQQVYTGQRPTWINDLNPILTADLRQLHLRNAQFNIGFGGRWTTWNPAGPDALGVLTLYFYKMWGEHRIEMKAGYVSNDLEFVGMQVGGSTATSALGVYAVLPYELGMSRYPLGAPSFNLRLRGPKRTYLKTGAQRSLDPAGGPATVAHNPNGFKFIPKGDRLLLINEVGYERPSSPTALQTWFRAGYLHNDTLYTNTSTGQREPGNYCAYVLIDHQISKPNPHRPAHGLYLGATAMTVPARFNSYDRYYELRVYQNAPLRSRPDDLLSLVAAYTGYSKYVTSSMAAQNNTVWHNSPSFTGSYSAHVARGNFLTLGLGYVHGPAITPRVANALLLQGRWGLYF